MAGHRGHPHGRSGAAFGSTEIFLILAERSASPAGGNEAGPFLSIDQAALSHIVPSASRTEVFAWYTLAGSLATAFGALCGGFVTQALQRTSMAPVASYRVVVLMYAAFGMLLAFLFTRLSVLVEVSAVPGGSVSTAGIGNVFGITRSRKVVLKLSSLFAIRLQADSCPKPRIGFYFFYIMKFDTGAIFSGCVCRDFAFPALRAALV